MTVGELAQMIKGEGWINEAPALDLTVVQSLIIVVTWRMTYRLRQALICRM